MQLIPFRRRDKSTRRSFLALPLELRLRIYSYCFEDSHTRYWREKVLRGRKLVKRACCKGPSEVTLLMTCHQVCDEASAILVNHAYFLLDQTKTSYALITLSHYYHNGGMSQWLRQLLQGTRRLVLSKTGQLVFWGPRDIFSNLESIDLFGFYPTLQRWIRRDRTISMGWGMWYWKLFFYHSPMRPTKNPRVHLGRAARWLHANLGDKPKIYLHAWELEDENGAEGSGKAYVVTIDLDTREMLTKERIMFKPRLDRCGTILENKIKEYHEFMKVTTDRRNEWLKEERKLWPELYPVTAIASEETK